MGAGFVLGGLFAARAGISSGPTAAARADPPAPKWTMAGQNLSNTRNQAAEDTLSAGNVAGLKAKGYDAWNVAASFPVSSGRSAPTRRARITTSPREPCSSRPADPATGAVGWSTVVGPGGATGGMQWGSATDGTRIYAAVANSAHLPYTLVSGRTTRGGAWSALDAATGAILWQTAIPGRRKIATGPVSVANGVVYAGSMARFGPNMYGLDAATGTILWRFASGGSVNSGRAVADGTVYWGSG